MERSRATEFIKQDHDRKVKDLKLEFEQLIAAKDSELQLMKEEVQVLGSAREKDLRLLKQINQN